MYIQRYTVVQRYSVVHLGLYLHACLCLLLPHHQPNPISASKFIYRYAYVRTQMYKQHVLTCILQDRLTCIWLISTRQEYAYGSYDPHARQSISATCTSIYMSHMHVNLCIWLISTCILLPRFASSSDHPSQCTQTYTYSRVPYMY